MATKAFKVQIKELPRLDSIVREVIDQEDEAHVTVTAASDLHPAEYERRAFEDFQRYIATRVIQLTKFELVEVPTGE